MNTLVQARVDADLKKSAEKILEHYGLDLPTLFRMTLCATVNSKGVPFPLSAESTMSANDFPDWKTADEAYSELKISGTKSRSIHKLASEIGV